MPGGLEANFLGSGLGGHTVSGTRLRFSTEGGGLGGAGIHLPRPSLIPPGAPGTLLVSKLVLSSVCEEGRPPPQGFYCMPLRQQSLA